MKRILHLTDEERSPHLNSILGVICAFIAGGINAGGFLVIGRYTSHVTGIISETAHFFFQHNWINAFQILGLIMGFSSGAAFAAYTIQISRYFKRRNPFALALMSSGSTLILLGIWAIAYGTQHPHELLIEFGLFFAMGSQNATVTQLSNNEVRATHMTGILTDLGIEIGNGLFSRKRMSVSKFKLCTLILGSFIAGGILGIALFQSALGIRSLLIYGGVLFALAALPIVKDTGIIALHHLKTHAIFKK